MKQLSKITIFILFLLLCNKFIVHSQNQAAISQYMYHHAIFNPAVMGSYNDIQAALLIRQQWVGIDGAPRLYALNVSVPYKKMGLGVSLFQSEIGVQKETRVYGAYSYRLQVARKQYFAFGIAGGMVHTNRDYASVVTQDQNDQSFSANVNSKITPDFQLGGYYFTPKFYVGIYIPSLLKSELSIENGESKTSTEFDKKTIHLFLQGGYEENLSENLTLNFSSLAKYVANAPIEVDINAMLSWQDQFGIGLSYRTKKEILALVNIRLAEQIRVAYAYQYSTIATQHFNSHEVMLLYSLANKKRRRLKIQSPRF
jgi:type IX secretion system PorP/SprF family membrane protein